MVAPKGPGHTVRSEYQRGGGVPCLIAVAQEAIGNAGNAHAKALALSYSSAVGRGRSDIIEPQDKAEHQHNRVGQMAVLSGSNHHLLLWCFKTPLEGETSRPRQ